MRIFLALLLVAGCKGGSSSALPPPKMDTARATAGSFAAAAKARSLDGIVALLPPADLLAKVVDCDAAALAQKLKDQADKTLKEVPEGQSVEVGGFDKFGTEDKSYRTGEDFEGCKVKAPFTE